MSVSIAGAPAFVAGADPASHAGRVASSDASDQHAGEFGDELELALEESPATDRSPEADEAEQRFPGVVFAVWMTAEEPQAPAPESSIIDAAAESIESAPSSSSPFEALPPSFTPGAPGGSSMGAGRAPWPPAAAVLDSSTASVDGTAAADDSSGAVGFERASAAGGAPAAEMHMPAVPPHDHPAPAQEPPSVDAAASDAASQASSEASSTPGSRTASEATPETAATDAETRPAPAQRAPEADGSRPKRDVSADHATRTGAATSDSAEAAPVTEPDFQHLDSDSQHATPDDQPPHAQPRTPAPLEGANDARGVSAPAVFRIAEYQGLAERPATPVAAADTPAADTADRLVQSMRVQFQRGGGDAIVHLRPEHLGPVTVTLRVEDGAVTARIHADNPVVAEWLQANEQTLREGLRSNGLHLDRLHVERDGQAPDQRGRREALDQRQSQRRREPTPHSTFEVTA
jgi:flagellar hook-length control protein FliK